MSLEQELRQTSDALLRVLDRISDLEDEKRALPTGSRRFVDLAQQIEDLAIEVLRRSEREATLAEDTAERREAGGGIGHPINEVRPDPRDLHDILADWRDAERRLASAGPATAESSAAAADVRRYREEFRLAREIRETRDAGRGQVAVDPPGGR